MSLITVPFFIPHIIGWNGAYWGKSMAEQENPENSFKNLRVGDEKLDTVG